MGFVHVCLHTVRSLFSDIQQYKLVTSRPHAQPGMRLCPGPADGLMREAVSGSIRHAFTCAVSRAAVSWASMTPLSHM